MIKKWSKFNEEARPRKKTITSNQILYSKGILKEDCERYLIDAIDNAFVEIHQDYNTISGDTDFTSKNLLSDDAVKMMMRQVSMNMNLESAFKSIKREKCLIDIDILKEINDERDSVQEDDMVIAIINSPYLEVCQTKAIRGLNGLYINSSDNIHNITSDMNGILLSCKKRNLR